MVVGHGPEANARDAGIITTWDGIITSMRRPRWRPWLPPLLRPQPHDREILRLAVPAFAALVAEPLFLLADSAIVGRLGTAELGGLGVAATVLGTLVNLCVFLAYGTTAGVARRLGAGDQRGALRQGIDGLWLAAGIGAALLAAGWPLAPMLVRALGASDAVHVHAVVYLRVSLLALPAMLLVLAGTGVLRGLQDTRTPLLVAVGASVANLVLNAWFVLGLGWGIAGSAWGTALVQVASALVYLWVVVRGARRHGAALVPDREGLRAAAAASASLFLRTLTLRVVLVAAAAVATRLGDAEIAAHQVAFNLWMLLALALDAVAIAGQAITGRSLGAGDVDGTRASTRRMVEWGTGAGVVLGLLVLVASPLLPGLFTADPAVRALLASTLVVVALLQPLCGPVFALDGILIGAGDLRYLARAGVLTMLAFLPPAAAVLLLDGGLVALWLAFGVFMLARLVVLTWRARGDAWLVTGSAVPRRSRRDRPGRLDGRSRPQPERTR
jgi:putative MATE family efflux protein